MELLNKMRTLKQFAAVFAERCAVSLINGIPFNKSVAFELYSAIMLFVGLSDLGGAPLQATGYLLVRKGGCDANL
jgi:hypothetical protein